MKSVPYGLEMTLRSLLTMILELQKQIKGLEKDSGVVKNLTEVQLLESILGV